MSSGSVLVVEDEGLIALHLAEILENEGYRVIGPVCSGAEALHLLKHSPKVDLILMDVKLPGTLDGIETARRVKSYCLIPLIFITAHTSEGITKRMKAVRPDGIIHKPFSAKEVVMLIAETIRRNTGKIPI